MLVAVDQVRVGGFPPPHDLEVPEVVSRDLRERGVLRRRAVGRVPPPLAVVGATLRGDVAGEPADQRDRQNQRGEMSDPATIRHPAHSATWSSHSRMRGVTISGTCVCGPWPTPGSTSSVSDPSTHRQMSLSVSGLNGPLSSP